MIVFSNNYFDQINFHLDLNTVKKMCDIYFKLSKSCPKLSFCPTLDDNQWIKKNVEWQNPYFLVKFWKYFIFLAKVRVLSWLYSFSNFHQLCHLYGFHLMSPGVFSIAINVENILKQVFESLKQILQLCGDHSSFHYFCATK